MSKTTIFLIVVVILAGVAIGIFTTFNPLATVQTWIQNPSTMIYSFKTLPQTFMTHIREIATGITGFGIAFTLFSKVYSKYKQSRQQVEHNLQSQVAEAWSANMQIQQEKAKLRTQMSTQQTQYTGTVMKLSNQFADKEEELRTVRQDFDRVANERNYWFSKAKEWEAKAKQRAPVP